MEPTTFYTDNLAYISKVCNSYVGENVAALAQAITPAAFALLGVYIILWGLASLRGLIEEPLMDMAMRVVKISLIFGIGLGLAEYNVLVTETFLNGPDQLAAAMAKAPTTDGVAGSLDLLFDQGFQIGRKFWNKAGILNGDPGLYLVAATVYGMTIAVTAYAFFLIALSKVAVSVLIALGALFIVSLLFEATKNYFSSWIQQMSNYFLVPVLVVAVNLLIMKQFSRAAEGVTSAADIDQVFPFLAMGLISLLILASVLSIAAGLAGGVSLSSFGVGRLAGKLAIRTATKAAHAAGQTGQAAYRGASKVARAGWRGYQDGRTRNSISHKP